MKEEKLKKQRSRTAMQCTVVAMFICVVTHQALNIAFACAIEKNESITLNTKSKRTALCLYRDESRVCGIACHCYDSCKLHCAANSIDCVYFSFVFHVTATTKWSYLFNAMYSNEKINVASFSLFSPTFFCVYLRSEFKAFSFHSPQTYLWMSSNVFIFPYLTGKNHLHFSFKKWTIFLWNVVNSRNKDEMKKKSLTICQCEGLSEFKWNLLPKK